MLKGVLNCSGHLFSWAVSYLWLSYLCNGEQLAGVGCCGGGYFVGTEAFDFGDLLGDEADVGAFVGLGVGVAVAFGCV